MHPIQYIAGISGVLVWLLVGAVAGERIWDAARNAPKRPYRLNAAPCFASVRLLLTVFVFLWSVVFMFVRGGWWLTLHRDTIPQYLDVVYNVTALVGLKPAVLVLYSVMVSHTAAGALVRRADAAAHHPPTRCTCAPMLPTAPKADRRLCLPAGTASAGAGLRKCGSDSTHSDGDGAEEAHRSLQADEGDDDAKWKRFRQRLHGIRVSLDRDGFGPAASVPRVESDAGSGGDAEPSASDAPGPDGDARPTLATEEEPRSAFEVGGASRHGAGRAPWSTTLSSRLLASLRVVAMWVLGTASRDAWGCSRAERTSPCLACATVAGCRTRRHPQHRWPPGGPTDAGEKSLPGAAGKVPAFAGSSRSSGCGPSLPASSVNTVELWQRSVTWSFALRLRGYVLLWLAIVAPSIALIAVDCRADVRLCRERSSEMAACVAYLGIQERVVISPRSLSMLSGLVSVMLLLIFIVNYAQFLSMVGHAASKNVARTTFLILTLLLLVVPLLQCLGLFEAFRLRVSGLVFVWFADLCDGATMLILTLRMGTRTNRLPRWQARTRRATLRIGCLAALLRRVTAAFNPHEVTATARGSPADLDAHAVRPCHAPVCRAESESRLRDAEREWMERMRVAVDLSQATRRGGPPPRTTWRGTQDAAAGRNTVAAAPGSLGAQTPDECTPLASPEDVELQWPEAAASDASTACVAALAGVPRQLGASPCLDAQSSTGAAASSSSSIGRAQVDGGRDDGDGDDELARQIAAQVRRLQRLRELQAEQMSRRQARRSG